MTMSIDELETRTAGLFTSDDLQVKIARLCERAHDGKRALHKHNEVVIYNCFLTEAIDEQLQHSETHRWAVITVKKLRDFIYRVVATDQENIRVVMAEYDSLLNEGNFRYLTPAP